MQLHLSIEVWVMIHTPQAKFLTHGRVNIPRSLPILLIATARESNDIIILLSDLISRCETLRRILLSYEFEAVRTPAYREFVAQDGTVARSIVVTTRPRNACAQGFVDDKGATFDVAMRTFAAWSSSVVTEDHFSGTKDMHSITSVASLCGLVPLWSQLGVRKPLRGK